MKAVFNVLLAVVLFAQNLGAIYASQNGSRKVVVGSLLNPPSPNAEKGGFKSGTHPTGLRRTKLNYQAYQATT